MTLQSILHFICLVCEQYIYVKIWRFASSVLCYWCHVLILSRQSLSSWGKIMIIIFKRWVPIWHWKHLGVMILDEVFLLFIYKLMKWMLMILKQVSTMFSTLEKIAQADPKYADILLLENYAAFQNRLWAVSIIVYYSQWIKILFHFAFLNLLCQG